LLQAAPAGVQLRKLRVVHDQRQLLVQLLIDAGDGLVNGRQIGADSVEKGMPVFSWSRTI
jgi:hypothetical protein